MKLPANLNHTTAIEWGLLPPAMTAAERTAGRFLRAPDHDAGTAGGAAGDATATGAGTEGAGGEGAAGGEGQGGGDEGTVLGGATAASETEKTAGTAEGEAGKAKEGEGGEGEGEAGSAPGVPEKYELTPPDGFEAIDTEVLAEAEPVLRELNLDNEQANKLMPIAGQLVKKTLERAEKAITDRAIAQRKEWSDAFEADPDIGGANKDKTIDLAARAWDHYGIKKGEGIRQILDESGLGNHPDMIRFVAKVGHDLGEGSFERGGTASTTTAPEQKLYGAEFQPKT